MSLHYKCTPSPLISSLTIGSQHFQSITHTHPPNSGVLSVGAEKEINLLLKRPNQTYIETISDYELIVLFSIQF